MRLLERVSLTVSGMDYEIRKATAGDLAKMQELLVNAGLPTAGVENHIIGFLVAASKNNELLAVLGMERSGSNGLLRSLACHPNFRKQGIGAELVTTALTVACKQGVKKLYLMTQTAEKYMQKFGFKTIERQEIPEDLLKQSELNTACSACSTCMILELG